MPPPNDTPKVSVLYSTNCPGGPAAAGILREVIAERAPYTELAVGVHDQQEFQALGTPGSPTILLNGRDLFPPATPFGTGMSCCRLYATPEGLKSHPTAGMVREALEEAGL